MKREYGRNSTRDRATALQYDGENTPTITAKGEGLVAQQILDIAEQHDILIHEDPILCEVLSQLELGAEIPEQLYLAVAQIIAFAYVLQDKVPDGFAPQQKS